MKTAFYYYRLAFILLFSILADTVFSQSDIWEKPQHIVAVGVNHTFDNTRSNGHFLCRVDNISPGFNLFYRFSLPATRNFIMGFSAESFYRKSNFYRTDGGMGGSSSVNGTFEVVKLNLGVYFFARPEDYGNFMLGGGLNHGGLVYSNGNATDNSSWQGSKTTNSVNVKSFLNRYYLSISIEGNYTFKLAQKKNLVIGLRESFEVPDFEGMQPNATTTLYLAYSLQ